MEREREGEGRETLTWSRCWTSPAGAVACGTSDVQLAVTEPAPE